jgi:hypothetical protein
MLVKELQVMAKDLHIKATGKKEELVNNILAAQEIKANAVEMVKQKLRESSSPDSFQHDHYRATFNAIDLHHHESGPPTSTPPVMLSDTLLISPSKTCLF